MRAPTERFQAFHKQSEKFFVIPDAWDVMSAVVLYHSGYESVSTTSVGLGFALGCPGDTMISKDEMLQMVRAICKASPLPVSVDLESGYADNADDVEDVVRETIEAGAAAIALEDSNGIPGKGLRPAEEHAERIRAARRAADKAGVKLFINGRTDPFWNNDGVADDIKAKESIRRANLYIEAGADGAFISGFKPIAADTLKTLVQGLKAGLSTLIGAGGPSVDEMEKIGVRRLHLGSLPTRAQFGYLTQAIKEMRENRDPGLLNKYAIPTKDINALVRPYWQTR